MMAISPDIAIITHADGNKCYLRGKVVFNDPTPLPPDTGPYDVGPFHVPQHGVYQAWTDRSVSPLKVVDKPAKIVANNRSFPFGDIGLPIIPMDLNPPVFKGPMDNAGVQKYMPTGGGGSDRSLITDYGAHFMRTGDPTGMFAQAQVADAIPINYVDANTGKPVDLIKYPLANTYTPGIKPWLSPGTKNADGVNYDYAGVWQPSMDHFPPLTYLAFQASHDIGLLYNLQHAANFDSIQHPYFSANFTGDPPKAIVSAEQTRELAWGLRCIFEAHTATKDAEALGILPADLHPSSYFKALLDNNLAVYGKQMLDPTRQTFRLIGPDLMVGHWQYDYLLSTLAFAVLTGHSDWEPLFLWTLGNIIARTNGTSGWPPALSATYYMFTVPGGGNSALPRYTWAQAFDDQMANPYTHLSKADHDAILAAPLKLSPLQDGTSLMGARFVLTLADYLDKKGLAKVRKEYPDFDTCLTNANNLMKSYGRIAERYCAVSIAGPDPVPPIDPPPPISTGDITMPAPAFNAPFTATVSFKDNAGAPMVPDSVSWDAPAAFKLTASPNDKLSAHGVYGVEGVGTIKATGTKDGVSVTVTKEVTVPAAAPFLATGEITLS
jgi:hypothetical protein